MKLYLWTAALAAILTLSGCGTSTSADLARDDAPTANKSALASRPNPVSPAKPPAVRQVIRKAQLTVRVADTEKMERQVTNYVTQLGGYVSGSESNDLTSMKPSVTMTVRVPSSQFDAAITYFESLGDRIEKRIETEDATTQLVDIKARLKTMLAQEETFRSMLKKAEGQSHSLAINNQLMELRGQIESLAAQSKALSELASLATINLSLEGAAKAIAQTESKGWVQESWNVSTNFLSSIFKGIGSLAIFFVVMTPLWLPFAIGLGWVIKKGRPSMPR